MVWDAKVGWLVTKDDQDLPGKRLRLIVARNVYDTSEVKYFVSNAPDGTPVDELLLVAFSRWRVERCFEDQKTELGFDHFGRRSYVGLKRHQAITAVSLLFLSEVHQELPGENTGADRLPGSNGGGDGTGFTTWDDRLAHPAGRDPDGTRVHPAPKRPSATIPYQDKTGQTRGTRNSTRQTTEMRMEKQLVL